MRLNNEATVVLMAAALIVGTICWWVGSSYMEAKSFSKLTGRDVSTWDAMWVTLRVQD